MNASYSSMNMKTRLCAIHITAITTNVMANDSSSGPSSWSRSQAVWPSATSGGTRSTSGSTSSVSAIATTPSLKAVIRSR